MLYLKYEVLHGIHTLIDSLQILHCGAVKAEDTLLHFSQKHHIYQRWSHMKAQRRREGEGDTFALHYMMTKHLGAFLS